MNELRKIRSHPEELLDAYALDALEDEETLQVEFHLEDCDRCRLAVAELHNAVSRLGQAVVQQQPPSALRPRLLPEPWSPLLCRVRPPRAVQFGGLSKDSYSQVSPALPRQP